MAVASYDGGDYSEAIEYAKYSYFNHLEASNFEDKLYVLDPELSIKLASSYEQLIKQLAQRNNLLTVTAEVENLKSLLNLAVSKLQHGNK